MSSTSSKTLIAILSLMFLSCYCHGANSTLTPGDSIRDGEMIISPSERFALGFFSPGDSSNRYVGIWYNKIPIQTVVWVANRENPVTGSSGVLTFQGDGYLVVQDGTGRSLWSSNSSNPRNTATVFLMDSGNLVLSVGEVPDTDRALWQSFKDPTDTFLPEMKAGVYPIRIRDFLTSWKSESDPSRGNFSLGFNPQGLLQVVAWRGEEKYWRSGLWNGQIFIGISNMSANYLYGFQLSDVGGKTFLSYTVHNSSEIVRFRIRWDGIIQRLRWDERNRKWRASWAQPARECEVYSTCGVYGSCSNVTSFEDVAGDHFQEVDRVLLPDQPVWRKSDNRSHCEAICLSNCSCKAYAYVPGIQCLTWDTEFVDVPESQEGREQIYRRLTASDRRLAAPQLGAGTSKNKASLIIVLIVVFGIIGSCTLAYILWRCRGKLGFIHPKRKNETPVADETRSREYWNKFLGQNDVEGNKGYRTELTVHNFQEILNATENFSSFNKLGEGGFGSVYKGKLPSGKEIAVKRLSKSSGQGTEEFKNEVIVISRLLHRNLVRLLGFCTQEDEKMLIYEYMPNKSLDAFAFDPTRKATLGWRKCFQIIEGIGRGILYLHRDSILKVIHRDLKPSNILLDRDLNPKIADFGMARIVGGDKLQENTRRVVGTYGYMSPEYAMEGLFSEKSDVYSFGVLLLEIITGLKNTGFYHHDESISLIQHVWKSWTKDKSQELFDPTVFKPCFETEMLRCVQVGLLCVQEFAKDRPNMSSVISMLTSEITTLPTPNEPAFIGRQLTADADSSDTSEKKCSINNVSITELEAR